jgi:hypothetical protein
MTEARRYQGLLMVRMVRREGCAERTLGASSAGMFEISRCLERIRNVLRRDMPELVTSGMRNGWWAIGRPDEER